MLLLLNHLPSSQVLMALSRKTDARDTTVKWICMTLTCLAPHSQACWRDFTFRLTGFKEGSTLMKANFRLDLTPNHPEEQTDGSPPPPPPLPDPIPGNVNPESNSACLLQASQFCAAAFVWLKKWHIAECLSASQRYINVDCHMLS